MTVNVAMVGLGYWGPNLIRNLASLPDVKITALCDLEVKRAETMRERFCPAARVTSDSQDIADDTHIDAVAIATPIRTHFALGSLFLAAGKHVLIEKPLARTADECRQLIELAERHKRVLMVGHVFEFNEAVHWVKRYLDAGELGKLFYVYSQRVSLGRIQRDVNALWSFAPHDLSIINYWLGAEPTRVAVRGFSYLNKGVEDVTFVTLEYPGAARNPRNATRQQIIKTLICRLVFWVSKSTELGLVRVRIPAPAPTVRESPASDRKTAVRSRSVQAETGVRWQANRGSDRQWLV